MSLTGFLFLIIFVAGLGLCVFRGPVWGLYTYVAVFYLHPPSRWWGATLPGVRWSLVAALVTFVCVLIRGRRNGDRAPFLSHGFVWFFALYVLFMWVQLPYSVNGGDITGAALFSKYLVLLYLIYEIVDSKERVRDFFLMHVAGCMYLGWLAYNAGGGGRLEGVGGPGIDDANTMTMHFGTGVIVGSLLLLTERGWRFWLPVCAMPLMLNGMVLGNSRGGFLGLVAGGLCLFWLKPPAYRKGFIAFGLLGVLLFGLLANNYFWDRMATLSAVANNQETLDVSAESRLVIVEAQWKMFLDHPFGAGYDGTAALSREYVPEQYLAMDKQGQRSGRSSHNTFMSVLVDQGIVGVLLLSVILIWIWKNVGAVTRRSGLRDPQLWGYGAAVAAALSVAGVAGLFAPYLKAEVQYWLVGLLLSLRQIVSSRNALTSASPVEPTSRTIGQDAGPGFSPEAFRRHWSEEGGKGASSVTSAGSGAADRRPESTEHEGSRVRGS